LLLIFITGCGGTAMVSVEDEQAIGAQTARQVENQIGLYNAEFLTAYIDSVGRRLVSELGDTPYSFRFKIIDQSEPNAFATPGGYIYLSRGMLALINNEDELAGILAHEISHVTERHHARQASRSVLPGILTLPGKAVGAVVGEDVGNIINSPIEAVGKVYLSSYSRDQEAEADLVGMHLAATAGYNPSALGQALRSLGRMSALMTGEEREFSFYDSHPTTSTRVSDIDQESARMQWQPARPFADQAGLFKRMNGMLWGPDNPAQGVFRDHQFLQADLDFSIIFPEGWSTVNTPNFVGAFEPEQEAMIILGGGGRPGDPKIPADAFIEEIREQAGIEPAESRAMKIGDWPGYVVRFEDTSGSEPVSLYYLWVTSPRLAFQVIALGADRYRDQLKETAMSLRNLTAEERESISGDYLRIAEGEAGESLTDFAARSGNILSNDWTEAINDLPQGSTLESGQQVKIILTEPYY
jgi:predicted Zn-dependent protease